MHSVRGLRDARIETALDFRRRLTALEEVEPAEATHCSYGGTRLWRAGGADAATLHEWVAFAYKQARAKIAIVKGKGLHRAFAV